MGSIHEKSEAEESTDPIQTPTIDELDRSHDTIRPSINRTVSRNEFDHHAEGEFKSEPSNNVLSRVASRVSRTSRISTVEPPPDGGVTAWTQCFCAWLVLFCSWGYTNAFGAFQAYYINNLNLYGSTVSWIGSINVFTLFFVSTFSGRALDAGLFVPVFAIGAVFQIVGIFTTSVSTTFWQLLLSQGVATGIGSGIFFCPSMGICATYFSKKRGIAVALATSGNSVGGMIYPIIVTQLLPKIGFGWTVRVLGFLNLACLAVVFTFMRPRLPPRKAGPLLDYESFRDLPYMLFVAGIFFAMWSLYFVVYFISSYAQAVLGMSFDEAANLTIVYNGIGVPARIVSGLLADRYVGVINTHIPFVITNAILTYCWIGVSNVSGFYILVCFYGLSSAAFQSLFPTIIATLTTDLRKTGTRLGMAFSIISFAGLTGAPIGGALVKADNGVYVGAQVWAGSIMLIAAGFILASRIARYGSALRVKC
ncbi:hypothetical protein MBLNU457_g0780t1 [Dothideomycetes sp. NU457]